MANFIKCWTEKATVFLSPSAIQRIGIEKSDALRQSERIAKVVFTDGSTGEYIMHRKVANSLDCTTTEQGE